MYNIFKTNPTKWFACYDFETVVDKQRHHIITALTKMRRFGLIYRKYVHMKSPGSAQSHNYRVRLFKFVPDGKYITFDGQHDKLNNKRNTKFVT